MENIGKYITIGIDIGSRQGKAVLLDGYKIFTAIEPTGFSAQETADNLIDKLLDESGYGRRQIDYLIGTGYGRVSMSFGDIKNHMLTEISCHGMGAAYLCDGTKTVLDIGGQDSKLIKVNPKTGQVLDFAMNDKCAAGTGRFLERVAEILGYEVTQIGEASLQANHVHQISSQCVVFAESEIISALALGTDSKDILAGVHASVVNRVRGLFQRIGIEKEVMFTGGVSNNIGMVKALEDMLGFKLAKPKMNPVYAGALGAALFGQKRADSEYRKKSSAAQKGGVMNRLDLSELDDAVSAAKEAYIGHKTGKAKNAAYICAYTPVEILASADVAHVRLFHTGNEKEISKGEEAVSPIACAYTKSLIGGFAEGYPLYKSIDKVYSFYTCSFMASAIQCINARYAPASIYAMPKLSNNENSLRYYKAQLAEWIDDLEKLTGKKISEKAIYENIKKYNKARGYLRKISSYRALNPPLLGGLEYQKIAASYYYLPIDELLVQLENISSQLKRMAENRASNGKISPRIMMMGGIVTEDDHKVEKLLEELGAEIVIEDHCTGYSPFTLDIPENEGDVLGSIAKGYLGKAPCANLKPLEARSAYACGLAKEYQIDGVIYYYMQFCPTYGMAKKSISDSLEKAGFPTLEIAGNYSAGDDGQVKTRVEAFLEILDKRKGR